MKKKKENKNMLFFVGIVIIILLNLALLVLNYRTASNLTSKINFKEEPLNYTLPELNLSNNPLSLDGFTNVKLNITDKIIILYSNCTGFGLTTNDFQIYSIKQGVRNSIDVRPTIHDTMMEALNHFNISLVMVKITDTKDDLYFANIYLMKGNTLLNIDTKPSDAIALAIRAKIPVYISNDILKNYGQNIC